MSVGEIVLKHASRCIPIIAVVAGLAAIVSGCADSHMAASNETGQSTSYRTAYGFSSEGPTTDVVTELKTSFKRADRTPQVAAAGPVQPGQPATAASVNGQQAAASGPAVVQQPAGPPPEEPTTTAYGLSSDGPTTDVYTALFGPKHSQ
jgi:hypothetical protein